ncbi:hypothetical protein CVT25_005050 [Psilocybe cyanescens]|uniref:Uncharacterized protein n=1 Tax=Psilocybe cyanescens TaxID=93625 RepID=A0A409XBK9_PSICY|nr:hypothetical protein CVT25_005050 [Psilocybe cyanescens]
MLRPDIPIPVNVQENAISSNLNGSMLLNFLMDMEMLPCLGTIVLGDFGSIDTFSPGMCAGLLVATTVLNVKISPITSDANANLGNNITSALALVSLGTTVTTTFIIGYKIHSVSRIHAAAYSLALLLYAIDAVVPSFEALGSPMGEASYYITVIVPVVTGMASTILVARIATNDNHTIASSTITHISGLQFESQKKSGSGCSGDAIGGDISISVHADDAELRPVIKVKRESSTDATVGDNQV